MSQSLHDSHTDIYSGINELDSHTHYILNRKDTGITPSLDLTVGDRSMELFELIGILALALIFLLFPISICLIVVFGYFDFHQKRFYLLKRFLITIGIIYCILIAIIIAGAVLSLPPTGHTLTENYFQHKKEFNLLVNKIQIDQKKGLERVGDDWTRPSDITKIGLTQENISDYRREFKILSIPRGFYAYPDRINFVAYATGLSISGSSMGYLYSTKTPKNYFEENCGYSLEPFKDLKQYRGCNGHYQSYTIYQPIDRNWYIYDDLTD